MFIFNIISVPLQKYFFIDILVIRKFPVLFTVFRKFVIIFRAYCYILSELQSNISENIEDFLNDTVFIKKFSNILQISSVLKYVALQIKRRPIDFQFRIRIHFKISLTLLTKASISYDDDIVIKYHTSTY